MVGEDITFLEKGVVFLFAMIPVGFMVTCIVLAVGELSKVEIGGKKY